MSMNMKIKIEKDNTDQIKSLTREAVVRGLVAVAIQANNYATMLCPVDTTRLRTSISDGIDEPSLTAYIGTNVEYAPYVEYGTSKMAAQPFIKPAVNNHAPEYKAIFQDYLKNA